VDLAVVTQLDCEPEQRFVIRALDVLRPIALMANAVSGPGHAKVCGTTHTGLRRRFD
jgi:hypothetical protein